MSFARGALAQAPQLHQGVESFADRTAIADALAQGLASRDYFVASFVEPMNELLGASFRPVDDVLRAQLAIPPGQGLLVASLRADGASAQAGLRQNDILLKLRQKPVATAEDVTKLLKAAGDATLPLEILRGGKPVTLQVKASQRVTLAPAEAPQVEYYFGFSLEPVQEPLRAQLGLAAGKGVVITDVAKDSPAAKAGIMKYDIAVDLGGKPVSSPEGLAQLVQANKQNPTSLSVLRAREPITLPITGAPRPRVDLSVLADVVDVRLLDVSESRLLDRVAAATEVEQLRRRLEKLENELKALRLQADKATQRREGQKP
jgi:S1-C subfamily serine protease